MALTTYRHNDRVILEPTAQADVRHLLATRGKDLVADIRALTREMEDEEFLKKMIDGIYGPTGQLDAEPVVSLVREGLAVNRVKTRKQNLTDLVKSSSIWAYYEDASKLRLFFVINQRTKKVHVLAVAMRDEGKVHGKPKASVDIYDSNHPVIRRVRKSYGLYLERYKL